MSSKDTIIETAERYDWSVLITDTGNAVLKRTLPGWINPIEIIVSFTRTGRVSWAYLHPNPSRADFITGGVRGVLTMIKANGGKKKCRSTRKAIIGFVLVKGINTLTTRRVG